ncbi:hypothetical protein C8J57DRAFT_1468524 [Mycena rebaudengoi]|nr:hypothetical protein C8J57DRAFT_1468524 [Mycena rebaudengoi]
MPETTPPTTHTLPHAQRLRLMRSTRKLGALLGETPLLVDAVTSPAAESRELPIASSLARAASLTIYPSTPSSLSSRRAHGRPDAVGTAGRARLCLTLARPSPSTSRSTSSALHHTPLPSPLSPAFGPAANANSLTPRMGGTLLRRRKTMAKLARMLGENVPPELVFRSSAPASQRSRAASTSRSSNSSHPSSLQPPSGYSSERSGNPLHAIQDNANKIPYPTHEKAPNFQVRRRATLPTRVRTASAAPFAHYPPTGGPSEHPERAYSMSARDSARSTSHDASMRTSYSSGSSIGEEHASASARDASQERLLVNTFDGPRGAGYGTSPRGPSLRRPPIRNATHRAENGWSGEWASHGLGVQSLGMEEVVRELRGLKGR